MRQTDSKPILSIRFERIESSTRSVESGLSTHPSRVNGLAAHAGREVIEKLCCITHRAMKAQKQLRLLITRLFMYTPLNSHATIFERGTILTCCPTLNCSRNMDRGGKDTNRVGYCEHPRSIKPPSLRRSPGRQPRETRDGWQHKRIRIIS